MSSLEQELEDLKRQITDCQHGPSNSCDTDCMYKESNMTWSAALDAVKPLLEKTIKAFGGCEKCYGKGYATQLEFASSMRGIECQMPYYLPCTCERGKQFAVALEKAREEGGNESLTKEKDALLEECAREVEKMREDEDTEGLGWDIIFGGKDNSCCPGDDAGEGYRFAKKEAARAIRTHLSTNKRQ